MKLGCVVLFMGLFGVAMPESACYISKEKRDTKKNLLLPSTIKIDLEVSRNGYRTTFFPFYFEG